MFFCDERAAATLVFDGTTAYSDGLGLQDVESCVVEGIVQRCFVLGFSHANLSLREHNSPRRRPCRAPRDLRHRHGWQEDAEADS